MDILAQSLKLYSFTPTSDGYKLYSCVENPSYVEYERSYNSGGKFKICALDTSQNELAFQNNNLIWLENDVGGIISYSERATLKNPSCGGELCEELLKRRAIFSKTDFTNKKVGKIITDLFSNLTPIPRLTIGSFETLGDSITISIEPGNFYDVVEDLCQKYNLGFKVYIASVSSGYANLVFDVYSSVDKSETVVLSPEYESTGDFNYKHDTKDEINFVRVLGEDNTYVDVTPDTPVQNPLLLKEQVYNCTTTPKNSRTTAEYQALLSEKGQKSLQEKSARETYNSNVTNMTFKFGVDYELGDIVKVISTEQGINTVQQITEFQRQFDSSGEYTNVSFGEKQKTLPDVINTLTKKTDTTSTQQPTEPSSGGGGGGGTTINISYAIVVQRDNS